MDHDDIHVQMNHRLRLVAWSIVGSLSFTLVAVATIGAWRTAIATACALLAACTGLVRGRPEHAGARIAFSWLSVVGAVFVAFTELPHEACDAWMGLLFLGYAMVQLAVRPFVACMIVGSVLWMAGSHDGGPWLIHAITVVASLALAALTFLGQRHYVLRLMRLRESEQRKTHDLAAALELARRELEERTRLEAERERILEGAIASQRLEAMGQIAAGVAHELNNVLSCVLSLASLMSERAEGDLREDLDAIASAARRGGTLTSSLLKFGRRNPTPDVGPVQVDPVLRELEPMLRRVAPDGTVEVHVADRLPSVRVARADLAQAVMNLCLNAFDAGAAKVVVDAREVSVDERDGKRLDVSPGNYVVFDVRDDGSGMTPEVRRRAFEPFFTTKASGTGLGLAQVYGAFRSVGGAVEIAESSRSGTTIRGYAPIDGERHVRSPAAPPAKLGSLRILVVDDEVMVARATARVLQRAGCAVTIVHSGRDAIVSAAESDFDAFLLDVSMPEMDGPSTLAALRQRAPNTPACFLSGLVDDDLLSRAAVVGAAAVLQKPITPAALLHGLQQLVMGAQRDQEERAS